METFYKNKNPLIISTGFAEREGFYTTYSITMHIGFRIEPRASLYLRQVVEDLVASGLL